MENQGLPKAMIMGIVGLIFVVMFGSSMFVTIDSGEKGVLFKKFGGGLEKDVVYGQGFHVIAPWNTLHVYDVKIHETFEKMEVLSKNGLSIKIDLSFRYMPIQEKIGYLHDEIGRENQPMKRCKLCHRQCQDDDQQKLYASFRSSMEVED